MEASQVRLGSIVIALISLAALAPPPAAGEVSCSQIHQFSSTGAAVMSLALDAITGAPLQEATTDVTVKFDEGAGTTVVCLGEPVPMGPPCDPRDPVCAPPRYLIPTEIVAMELVGSVPGLGTVRVTESTKAHSTGAVVGAQLLPDGRFQGGQSFFDVFVDLAILPLAGPTVRGTNCHPFLDVLCTGFRVEADLDPARSILPPTRDRDPAYLHPPGARSIIWDLSGKPIGELVSGCHKPYLASVPGHRICLLATGSTTPDAAGTACLQNAVEFGVMDVSGPAHTITSVSAVPVGVLLTPWIPTIQSGELVWTSFANSASPACAPAALAVSGAYSDAHASPTLTTSWMQHA